MYLQSFHDWLLRETASSRMALITLYEYRDHLLYMEAPELRKKYLSIFGDEENAVLQAELENALLRRKIELIQTAINRREPIDLFKIDETISRERDDRLSELEQKDATLNELPQLSDQEIEALKKLYHDITGVFHPAMNKDLSDTQKELYNKAVEAFRMMDVDAMQVIHDSLFDPSDVNMNRLSLERDSKKETDERELYHDAANALSTDYSLAKTLYPYFVPLEDDTIVENAIADCNAKRKEIEEEIGNIRSDFPFNAVETMNSSAKTAEYRIELKIRAQRSAAEKAELQKKIIQLTE
ncbi:MAG: hypothetical protein K6F09_03725 [Clostridiales bacterium]|nr:hypothetical protein [Clostridiales bacterium]